jgi:ABC-type glycerol-3-phosphate transport system permease component
MSMKPTGDHTNWNRWYAAVLLFLLVQIVVYYCFTRYWI